MKRIVKNGCKLFLVAFAGLGAIETSHGQEPVPTSNRIEAQADNQYDRAGKFKRVFLGEHYRKEWATAVDLEILDFETMAGGLTPIKLGGGMQTTSLRLRGADGKEYVLRSVKKDPSKALPAELKGTIADDILQDQISSSNPFAALAVASLAETAGILHSTPRIFYIQHSKRLGQYDSIFANSLGLLEERPAGTQENNAGMGHATDIINSQKLFERVHIDNHHRVDEKAYIKARLFDMLIGDWDRHEDQWSWAEFRSGNEYLYKPVPRDRDQAFAKLDGIIPRMATKPWALRKIKDFDYEIPDIAGLNMSGNHLDRNFTTQQTKNDWIDISTELQTDLTDYAIETSIRKMPPEIFAISGESIIAKLKKRRDALTKYATEYYQFLSREVNITGTKKAEIFKVHRLNADSTLVIVFRQNGAEKEIVFKRTFLHTETKEIRLYGMEGEDKFEVDGHTTKSALVRIIGGKGMDSITDASMVNGTQHKTKVYDDATNFIGSSAETKVYISTDSLKNNYDRKAFVYDWFGPKLSPGYNPDDGIYIGGGIVFRKQQFGKPPYGYMHAVWGNYAVQTGAYNFWYAGEFKQFIGKWDLRLDAKINAPNYVRNYYGSGNETKMLVEDKKYYRIRLDQEATSLSMNRQFTSHHRLAFGGSFETIRVEENKDRFISDVYAKMDSGIFERKYYTGLFVNYEFNTLDNSLFPRKGMKITSGVNYVRNVGQDKNLIRVNYESSVFFSRGKWTAALRSGVAANLNDDFEFYQANTLGGSQNLRGYGRDRFAGKTSVYNNTELRFRINRYNGYIFRGDYGVFSFIDHGRVWIPEEKSNTWHTGYGGGLWIFIYNRIPITATYGISNEAKIITIKAGFLF